MSIKGIQSLSLCWFVFWAEPTYIVFLCTFNDIFARFTYFIRLGPLLFVSKTHSVVILYGVSYMGSQSTITFGIKSTMFTLSFCMKVILAHYRYIWTLPVVVSLRGSSSDSPDTLSVVFLTIFITCESHGTSLQRGFKLRRFLLIFEIKHSFPVPFHCAFWRFFSFSTRLEWQSWWEL